MSAYLVIKWLHILSAAVLFGTGLGTAIYMWLAHRTGDSRVIAAVFRMGVRIDWVLTGSTGVLQPVTGVMLIQLAGYDTWAPWLLWSYALYALAFACWVPVVWLQIRCRDLADESARASSPLPEAYHYAMRWWFGLGWPAFMALLGVYWLMLARSM